jgi:hypothetical protein
MLSKHGILARDFTMIFYGKKKIQVQCLFSAPHFLFEGAMRNDCTFFCTYSKNR